MTTREGRGEPIAVVGMALRVPAANTPGRFWRNILAGKDSLTRPSVDELRRAGVSLRNLADPDFIRAHPRVNEIEYFDASFFGMAGFEAERTDPTHRMFLECAWETMEMAGIVPDGTVTGVFAGTEASYQYQNLDHLKSDDDGYSASIVDLGKRLPINLGNELDYFTARVSHKLNLNGPSFALMAACATSLLATHLAVQSLRRGECDVAIAGGASLRLPQTGGYLSSVEGMLSTSGRVSPFDASADGTIFGDGAGAVALRRLDDAIADGNPIFAVIRGSGVSNDGDPAGKESFIAPSSEGQIIAVAAAMADAGVDARSIGYVEAHGTATLLGDPVEVATITDVYRRDTADTGYCGLGSVKGNVGHLSTAAGVVGLIKACLALKHRMLPPQANFTSHNPRIDFGSSPFFVNTEPLDWVEGAAPRRAAVSAFGFGGANAHAIVEEYVGPPAPISSRRHHLFPLSAKTDTALTRRQVDLATAFDKEPELEIADVAHTLQCGREAMSHRACIHVDGESFAASDLLRATPRASGIVESKDRPVVFLFPGQGAQRPGMGQDVYAREPVYRDIVDRCTALLEPELGFDIRSLIHLAPGRSAEDGAAVLRQTANAQPALFVVEYALARLFMSWGVKPKAMLGHSIGEIAAACVAGVFSLEDGLKMVAARARLMQQCDPGAMAAVFMPEAELKTVIGDDLEIAALNAPAISVVSGPTDAVASFIDKMADSGVGMRNVATSHAFHSRMMEPALPAFREVLQGIELKAPTIPVISNATGVELSAAQAIDPGYWSDHIRHTVRFSDGVEHLRAAGDHVFLELGPGRTLAELVRQHEPEADLVTTLEGQPGGSSDDGEHTALTALGRLWCAGGAVDWRDHYGGETRHKVVLPTYPFERRRYWLEKDETETKTEGLLHIYEPGWRLAQLDEDATANDGRPWLIFRDEHGFGTTIAEILKAQNNAVISLIPGDAFAEVEPDLFTVRPDSRDDLRAALAKAGARDGGQVPQVLHLWSVTGPSGGHNTFEAFEATTLTGYHSLVALIQAAYDNEMCEDLDVLAVADGLRQIDGEDGELHTEKGSLLGPVRTIPKEIPGLSMRAVDVSGFADGNSIEALCAAIIDEARARDYQLTICLRPQGRFVEELYPYTDFPFGRLRLRDGGTVLITGGVGGLGLLVAGTLFDEARARLVLTSRWQPPPRDQWAARAGEDGKIGQALRKIIALEERGAEVMIVTTEMTDRDGMRQAVAEAEARFGPINGVIHAAGVTIEGPAIEMRREEAKQIFESKVQGAYNLEDIFAQTPLDFFIHFSSLASYTPAPGQVTYSAANSVLDSLADRRAREHGGLSSAIGWTAWEEVGMAVARSKPSRGGRKRLGPEASGGPASGTLDHPLIQTRHDRADGGVAYRGLFRDAESWLFEHRFVGRPLLAAVTIVDCLYTSYVDRLGGDAFVALSQVAFLRPAYLYVDGTEIEIEYTPAGDADRFEVRSRRVGSSDEWTVNAAGMARAIDTRPGPETVPKPGDLPVESLSLATVGKYITFGRRWDCVRGEKAEGDATWLRLLLADEFRSDLDSFRLHTALIDRALHAHTDRFGIDRVPFAMDEIRVYGATGAAFLALGTRQVVGETDRFDYRFFDDHGDTLVEIDGYVMRNVEGSVLEQSVGPDEGAPDAPRQGLAEDQRIVVTEPGNLESLLPQSFEPRAPGPGEVQIEVVAHGLNFRDILIALDQLPAIDGAAPTIGGECSGIVRAVGDGVLGVSPGDPVVAMAPEDSFAGLVTTRADWVLPVPPTISIEDAAGIPTVFLTADHALNELAELEKGERILIHAAAGGVGLAAVQLAQKVGAEIFATAGHEDKRQYLRGLGVEHVMDSRSLDFVDEIREITNGEGVDVVLNSLAGEFIPASLGLLRYRGRFLEIGKRDIYEDTKIGLLPFRNSLAYYAIDLAQMVTTRDPTVARLLDSLMLQFASRELVPIPTSVVPIEDLGRGLKRMARAEHIGKIVFKVRDDPDPWRASFKRFHEMHGNGIPVIEGIDTLRRVLSSNRPPSYVLVLGDPVEATGRAEYRVGAGEKTRPDLQVEYRAPSSADEETLVRIWENTLGVSPIGVDDDFFDLGGDSITAIQIQFSVASACDVKLPTTVLFDHPTISGLAGLIRGGMPTNQ